MAKSIDPEWTIENDRQSVTVGINHRLGLVHQQGLDATLIRLGKEHSRLFWQQRGVPFIPQGPTPLISGDVYWSEEENCWYYKTKPPVPMRFNDPKIIGIAAEGVSKPEKHKKKSI
ncbi:MAG: hypothetical protein GXY34_00135 [Syntrophomonadaceae bacterium]|nr:hypothetical protein [Syntrophomonadaceae bacterium]